MMFLVSSWFFTTTRPSSSAAASASASASASPQQRALLLLMVLLLSLPELARNGCHAFVPSARQRTLLADVRLTARTCRTRRPRPCLYHAGFEEHVGSKRRTRTSSIEVSAAAVAAENNNDKKNDDGWQAGDVEADFQRLEQAIAFSNAEQNLQHQERLEVLEYHAQQRRSVAADLYRNVLMPTVVSFAVAAGLHLVRSFCIHRGSIALWIRVRRAWQSISLLHFGTFSVMSPILFCLVKRRLSQKNASASMPEELQGLDPDYFRFTTTIDWQDPETSCDDYVLCLLEQWVTAVAGIAVVGPALFVYYRLLAAAADNQSAVGPCWTCLLLIVTRLAVVASWHQYPTLWFQLIRRQQPRPVTGSVWALQTLVKLQCTPWMVGLDVACLAASLPQPAWAFWLYATTLVSSAIAAVVTRFYVPSKSKAIQWMQRASQWKPSWGLLARFTAILCVLGRRQHWIDAVLQTVATVKGPSSMKEFFLLIAWKSFLTRLGVVIALVGPICYFVALCKLVRVSYTHNLSLGMGTEAFQGALQAAENETKRQNKNPTFQWRYKLSWREPERIRVTFDKWRRGFWYWFFFHGSVQEKLRRETGEKIKNELKARGLTVLQRMAEDLAKNPNAPMNNSTAWKENAMERLRQQHQADYDANTYHDPLGVAVQQSFNIGLGYVFDHMSNESEIPVTRRLQARAAKSAIKRVRDLYNAEAAREELDSFRDPAERDKRKVELRQKVDDEIQQMARRLAELIPTDLSLSNQQNGRVEKFYNVQDFERVSRNELVMPFSLGDMKTPALQSYFSGIKNHTSEDTPSYEIDYLNPMGNNTSSDAGDDEFIEAWKRQMAGSNTSSNENDEDAIDTVLV